MNWHRRIIVGLAVLAIVTCLPRSPSMAQSAELTQNFQRGTSLYKAGLPEAAVPFMRNALILSEREFGPDATRTAFIRHNLAILYRTLGRNDMAEPEFRRALGVLEGAFGTGDAVVNEIVEELSLLLIAQNRYREAEPYLQRVLKGAEATFGKTDPRTAAAAYNLAEAEAKLGDRDSARRHYQHALQIWQSTSNSGDEKIVLLRERMAALDNPRPEDEVIRLKPPPQVKSPPTATNTQVPGTGAWRVQLAAFRTRDAAQHAVKTISNKLDDLLGGQKLEVQTAHLADATVFRVRTGPLPDRTGAQALCGRLKQRGQACFVTNK